MKAKLDLFDYNSDFYDIIQIIIFYLNGALGRFIFEKVRNWRHNYSSLISRVLDKTRETYRLSCQMAFKLQW